MNAVSMSGITKRFGTVVANDGIDFELRQGEIHALLGENGAGKTTLMKILYGLYQPDAGEIIVHGRRAHITSPADAIALGIGMVTQHFSLVPTFTVAENIALGLNRHLRLDRQVIEREVAATAERYGFHLDPAAIVGHLSVGEQQRVEILKALHRNARVLILDEPTAVLTPQETEVLFDALNGFSAQGLSVAFISHKLDEVLAISQRITVLRDGRVVGTVATAEADRATLARMMVGRETFGVTRQERSIAGAPVLQLEDVWVEDARGLPALRGVSLTVQAGEILGVAGVSGNGQRELADVLSGICRPSRGRVRVDNHDLTGATPSEVARAGVGRIPEDRLSGIIGELSVAENLALEYLDEYTSRRGVLDRQRIHQQAQRLIAEYDIRAAATDQARTLSGGNLQKLILARVLSRQPGVVLAAQPTRGLDVGATEYVRRQLLAQRDRGAAVLLISEDLDEILALSDRIAVMYEGRIVGLLPASEADEERLGLMMAGAAVGEP